MSDRCFETKAGEVLNKPAYLFGDSIKQGDGFVFSREIWLHMIDSVHIFLPEMSSSYGLNYLQSNSIPRKMNWFAVREVNGMTLAMFAHNGSAMAGEDRG